MPAMACAAKCLTSTSVSVFSLSSVGFTWASMTLASRKGEIFCRVFATLKRTLATGSAASRRTVGSSNLVVISVPQTSAKTFRQNKQVIPKNHKNHKHILII